MPRKVNIFEENPLLQAGDYAVNSMEKIAARVKETQRKAAVTNFLQRIGQAGKPQDFEKQRRDADEIMRLSQLPQTGDPAELARLAYNSQQKIQMIQYNAMIDEAERQAQQQQMMAANLGTVGFMNPDERNALEMAFPKISGGYGGHGGGGIGGGGLAGLAAQLFGKKGTAAGDGAKNEFDTRIGIGPDGKPHLFRINKDNGAMEDTGIVANEQLASEKAAGGGKAGEYQELSMGTHEAIVLKQPSWVKTDADLKKWFAMYPGATPQPGNNGDWIFSFQKKAEGGGGGGNPLDAAKFALDVAEFKLKKGEYEAKANDKAFDAYTKDQQAVANWDAVIAQANAQAKSKSKMLDDETYQDGWRANANISLPGENGKLTTANMTPIAALALAVRQRNIAAARLGWKPISTTTPKKK